MNILGLLGFKDFYQFFVTWIASLFGIAIASGRIDQFASMFLLISLFTVAVLAIDYINLFANKEREKKDYGMPLVKAFCSISIFMFFSVGSMFAAGIDNITEGAMYYVTWAYTGIVVSAYMIQILQFGKKVGLPGMGKMIEIVENVSSIFTKRTKK